MGPKMDVNNQMPDIVSSSPTAVAPASGPDSVEVSEEGAGRSGSCQSDKIAFGGNYLRHMARKHCKEIGIVKKVLAYGDSFVAKSGNVISIRHGRIGLAVCKHHDGEYQERMANVGRECGDCYARGILVHIGDKSIRVAVDISDFTLWRERLLMRISSV